MVVQQWEFPGGRSLVIVVDSAIRSEAGMRALGEQLRYDLKDERSNEVFIYDNERAARMRDAADHATIMEDGSMSKDDLAFYYGHLIGSYSKNGSTGFHRLAIMLQGVVADKPPVIEVNYLAP